MGFGTTASEGKNAVGVDKLGSDSENLVAKPF